VIAIHAAPLDAVHVQSRVVVIVSAPVAPAAGADAIELSTLTWHLGVEGAVTEMEVEPQAAWMSAARTPASPAICSRARIGGGRRVQAGCPI